MKTFLEMIAKNWKRLKSYGRSDDFEIFEFDHQPFIDCYLNEDKSE